MSPVGPAIEEPATRRSVLRRWLNVAVLGFVACSMLVLAVWKVRSDADARALQRGGTRADATIVAILSRPVGRGGFRNGSVRVRFEAANETRESLVYVGRSIDSFQLDQRATVVYDASDPSRVELLGLSTPTRGLPAVLAFILAVLLSAMAIVAGRRARQITVVVRSEPWQVVSSRLNQFPLSVGFRRGSRTMVELYTSAGAVRVEPAGLSRVIPSFEPEVWVVGLDAKTIVLATPGGGHVIAARRR